VEREPTPSRCAAPGVLGFLHRVAARMRERVLRELTTTFASDYSQIIGLSHALEPEILLAYERKARGEKFLIDPTRN
jgi:NADPH2:quinone reductase